MDGYDGFVKYPPSRRVLAFNADDFLGGVNPNAKRDAWGDREEPWTREQKRVMARLSAHRALEEALGGPIYTHTTYLRAVNGDEGFKSVPGPDGRPLMWGMWFPRQRALMDVFTKVMPPEAELTARMQFAEKHGIKYGYVPPGMQLSLDALVQWALS